MARRDARRNRHEFQKRGEPGKPGSVSGFGEVPPEGLEPSTR